MTDVAYAVSSDTAYRQHEKVRLEQELNGYLIPKSARKAMKARLDSSSVCDSSNEAMDTTQTILSSQKMQLSPYNAPNKF